MQLFFFLFGFYNSTCFGRSLRPSSGILQTVVAATGVCHGCGDSYTGFILPRPHDTHQWLLRQFVILLMMDAKCVRNM